MALGAYVFLICLFVLFFGFGKLSHSQSFYSFFIVNSSLPLPLFYRISGKGNVESKSRVVVVSLATRLLLFTPNILLWHIISNYGYFR